MGQPNLKRRRVNRKIAKVEKPGPSYELTPEQRAAAKKRRAAAQAATSIAGIRRTGGFGIAD